MKTSTQTLIDSDKNRALSGVDYVDVNLSAADYLPPRPFKAIFLRTDGNVVLASESGNQVTFPLTAGLWPLGGRAIIKTGTTATLVAIF